MGPNKHRDLVVGPENGPEAPYPIRLAGPVIKGFGRGSKELGVPTANIPPEGLDTYPDLPTGVYYGVVALDPVRFVYNKEGETAQCINATQELQHQELQQRPATILPAVLSIGYNPFYKNEVRSVEIHILPSLSSSSPFSSSDPSTTVFHHLPDFYGTRLNLLILGYIRPEYDYVSREALIEDIRVDCEVAITSLSRPAYASYLADETNGSIGNDTRDEDGISKVKEQRKWLRNF